VAKATNLFSANKQHHQFFITLVQGQKDEEQFNATSAKA